jgi:hypothetical protein
VLYQRDRLIIYTSTILQVKFELISPAPKAALADLHEHEKQQNLVTTLVWVFIILGILLRLFHYFDNRSLWIDEVYLSTSLIKMSFWELTSPSLDYQQKAPLGFLWLVKACVMLFGKEEMALRLIPLLTGIASLFVFLPVARYFLKPLGVMMAVGIMALAPVLVYHSVEIKQYSTEMFAAVLSLYLYTRYHGRFDQKSLLMWGVWGALLLWISYSAIFFLAGIAIAVSLHYLLKRDWQALFLSIIPFTFWLLSFGLSFYLFISRQADAEWLVVWFRERHGFPPLNASVGAFLGWLFQSLYRMMIYPLGVLWNAEVFNEINNAAIKFFLKMSVIMFLFWGIGYAAIFRRNRMDFLVLLIPFVLTLVATVLQKYPFYDRLLVFLAPIPILLLAHGCQKVTAYLPAKVGKLRYLMPAILLFWPFYSSAQQVVNTDLFGEYKKSYYKEGILYMHEHMQEGDVVLLYWNARPFYNFYNAAYDLNINGKQLSDVRLVSEDAQDYLSRLRPEYKHAIGKKRVWFVYDPWLVLEIGDYDHKPDWYLLKDVQGGRLLHKDFTTIGREIDSFIRQDIEVRLYDLSGQE